MINSIFTSLLKYSFVWWTAYFLNKKIFFRQKLNCDEPDKFEVDILVEYVTKLNYNKLVGHGSSKDLIIVGLKNYCSKQKNVLRTDILVY